MLYEWFSSIAYGCLCPHTFRAIQHWGSQIAGGNLHFLGGPSWLYEPIKLVKFAFKWVAFVNWFPLIGNSDFQVERIT